MLLIRGEGVIEAASHKLGLPDAKLTPSQSKLPRVKIVTNLGASFGITIGCLLGLLPLLWIDQKERHFKAIFEAFDVDDSGFIELEEIKKCMDSSGIAFPKEWVEGLMAAVDKSKDGRIDYEEFRAFMLKLEVYVSHDTFRSRVKNNQFVKWIHEKIGD
jgi:hypothetical protein